MIPLYKRAMSVKRKEICVIGAGASGMMAAIQAARAGCRVTIYEKQNKTGRKLAITGNGQCNITNRFADVSRYHGSNPDFVRNVFARFGVDAAIDFFASIGIPLVEKKNGKLYPHSLQAQSVVDLLEYELGDLGVELLLHRRVDAIDPDGRRVRIVTAGHESTLYDAVILAAGSCAYPQLGASHQGYELAAALGHRLIDPFPAILPLNIPLRILHRLEGVKWDAELAVQLGNRIIAGSTGELLFTKYGISGPVALDVSRYVNESLLRGKTPRIILNLFPEKNVEEVSVLVRSLLVGKKTAAQALSGLLKKRMPDVFLSLAGIDPAMRAADLSEKMTSQIIDALTALPLDPGEPRPFSESVVAAGGIPVDEVDPSTMESRKVKGVFLCGEILDIDGDSGGFNLQFAWSTGALAGMSQI